MNDLIYKDLHLIEYSKALQYQELLFKELIINKDAAGHLIICEHPNVFTLGKSGDNNNFLIEPDSLKKIDASFVKTNRGGDITYHGPGQIVGYPILNLKKFNISIKEYIYNIEEVIIKTLSEYGIKGVHYNKATGVWLDIDNPNKIRKICAIGVKVSKFITMHGFALNTNTNLNYFSYINPCGFTDKGVTSIEKEIGYKVNIEDVKKQIKQYFIDIFDAKFQ